MPGNLEALPSLTISDGHMFVGGDTHLQGSIQLGQVLSLLAFWYKSTNTDAVMLALVQPENMTTIEMFAWIDGDVGLTLQVSIYLYMYMYC